MQRWSAFIYLGTFSNVGAVDCELEVGLNWARGRTPLALTLASQKLVGLYESKASLVYVMSFT